MARTPTRRIVVGADLSPAGSAALLWAVRQARRTDSHVMVLDSRPSTEGTPTTEEEVARKVQRWRVQAWVNEVMLSVQARVPVMVSTTEGRLELALAGAGSRADLVVFADDHEDGVARVHTGMLTRFCPCSVVRVNRHQVPEYLTEVA